MEPGVKHTYMCSADEWFSEKCEVSIAPQSFARGGMRKCHRCFEKVGDGGQTYSIESVAKFSMIHRDGRSAKAAAFADAKMQMVAEYWAQAFNRKSPPDNKVAFVVAQVLELPSRPDGPQRWASLEPLLEGEYAKFNNNAGAVLGGRTAQAFSHFTVHESSAQMCICDLQGVGGSLFTDPQIHSTASKFGDGNLGRGGIERFLASHRCNEVCRACRLPEVEHKQRASGGGRAAGGGGGGGGGGGMPVGGMPVGGMGMPIDLMRGGMGAGAGMSVPLHKLLERMMLGHMGGQMGGRMFIGGGGGGGGAGGGAGGGGGGGGHAAGGNGPNGADELRAALRASDKSAAAEDERRLREALRASGGGGGGGGYAHQQPRGRGGGDADLDLQRAIAASVQRPPNRR